MKGQFLAAALGVAVIGSVLPVHAASPDEQQRGRHVAACTFYEDDARSVPDTHHAHRLRDVCHVMATFAEVGMWGPAFEAINDAMHDYRAIVTTISATKADGRVTPEARHLIVRRLGLARMSRVFLARYGEALAAATAAGTAR